MNITVVVGHSVRGGDTRVTQLREWCSSWGTADTWKWCATDNVVCADNTLADELIEAGLYYHCNLWVAADRQDGVTHANIRKYGGRFENSCELASELVALALVAGISDCVLLIGYGASEFAERTADYQRFFRSVVESSECEFVFVDDITEAFTEYENVTHDTFARVVKYLSATAK